jgi:peroxiredoxin
MALTPSTMLPLGTAAPDIQLPDTNGKTVALADFKDSPALLVLFICNHCPYVKHIRAGLAQLARDYLPKHVAIVGINSNDAANYPDDSPAKMKDEVKSAGYLFPYLYDETQAAAKAYRAACTPDIFLFDRGRRVPATGFPSPAKICAPRSTPCSRESRPPSFKSPASAATSNGNPATSRIIFDLRFTINAPPEIRRRS